MKHDYDVVCIGLGPAGMAVSVMASEMGLKVCAIEKNKIGGECMNVGCIPSKSLLRMAKARNAFDRLDAMELETVKKPSVKDPFKRVRDYVYDINETKTKGMFKKVKLILQEGEAEFVDEHTVRAAGKDITARKIFIATGTEPAVPMIEGIENITYYTNKNIFNLSCVPERLTIIGGGAIGCEMAQAFLRLGSSCAIVHMDSHLLPNSEACVGAELEKYLTREGAAVNNGYKILKLEKTPKGITLYGDKGLKVDSDAILVAAGRKMDISGLKPENAGILYTKAGITVNKYLQTSQPHIYAVGDCNGAYLLTHAAMHQGMIALMNSMLPWPFKKDFKSFVVPWTVFTEPEVSMVGLSEKELKDKGISYEVIETKYENYGAAIAENAGEGFLRVLVGSAGKIYGVSIVGEGAGEMINEWALAIQKKIRIYDIMMLQHSFPTMGFLTKRASELWLMNKMKSETVKNICRFIFRIQ